MPSLSPSLLRLCLLAVCFLITSCATVGDCNPAYAHSPQYKNCLFANPPNPDTPPGAGTWTIWSRFIFASKQGTVPVDPIPVQPLTPAALQALDAQANHVVRLGHSSHLLKLQGKFWLIDPMFGDRASPLSFAGPRRFHAPPIRLQDLPPIEGLILSHDHYDHLDVPTIDQLAQRVQRYFVPLGVKARLVDMGVPAERVHRSSTHPARFRPFRGTKLQRNQGLRAPTGCKRVV